MTTPPSPTPAESEPLTSAGPEVTPLWVRICVVLAIARFAIPLAAIPAIPWLVLNDTVLLVLLRPQKEFLLLAGGQTSYLEQGPGFLPVFLAFAPMGILSVATFFVVGRAYRARLEAGDGPKWLHRAIPPKQLAVAQRMLARRGPAIAFIGRIAAMPPTVLGAAAGLSDVRPGRYLVADALGGFVSFTMMFTIGYGLGRAYEEAGLWVTIAGVVLVMLLAGLVGVWFQRESEREEGPAPA